MTTRVEGEGERLRREGESKVDVCEVEVGAFGETSQLILLVLGLKGLGTDWGGCESSEEVHTVDA